MPGDYNPAFEGYVSDDVVTPGDTVDLHVGAPDGAGFHVVIERLGWYRGAGGRSFGCIPDCATWLHGQPGGDEVVPLHIGQRWPSGLYEARIAPQDTNGGPPGLVFFTVGENPMQRAQALVVLPFTTWQAYNNYGGRSLYDYNSTDHRAAVRVSMDRPLAPNQFDWFSWDYPLIRFLERTGADVAYTSDVDVDRHPEQVLGRGLVIVSGHSEYWSKGVRDALESARDSGVDEWFMGADQGEWQIRYEDDYRTIVEYRSLGDPVSGADATGEARSLDPPRPECTLLGNSYVGGFENPPVRRDFTIAPGAANDPWLAGTGLADGQVLAGLVGFEWDTLEPNCVPPGETVLLTAPASDGQPGADAVLYTAPSGATVFSTGSLQFVWALDRWARPTAPHWAPLFGASAG